MFKYGYFMHVHANVHGLLPFLESQDDHEYHMGLPLKENESCLGNPNDHSPYHHFRNDE